MGCGSGGGCSCSHLLLSLLGTGRGDLRAIAFLLQWRHNTEQISQYDVCSEASNYPAGMLAFVVSRGVSWDLAHWLALLL